MTESDYEQLSADLRAANDELRGDNERLREEVFALQCTIDNAMAALWMSASAAAVQAAPPGGYRVDFRSAPTPTPEERARFWQWAQRTWGEPERENAAEPSEGSAAEGLVMALEYPHVVRLVKAALRAYHVLEDDGDYELTRKALGEAIGPLEQALRRMGDL